VKNTRNSKMCLYQFCWRMYVVQANWDY